MKWLARLLGSVPAEEREGICLPRGPHWQIDIKVALSDFFLALPEVTPPGSVLYLEDGFPSEEVRALFEKHAAEKPTQVALGTLWPRPQRYHIGITRDLLDKLAGLAETRGAWEFGLHIHVYHEQSVVVEWYDAPDPPMWLSKDIPEETVARFSARLGVSYQREEYGDEE